MSTTTASAPSTTLSAAAVDPILGRPYEIFNARDFTAIPSCFADDAVIAIMPTDETLHGHAGAEAFMQGWATAFPDSRVEIGTLLQSGDTGVCEFVGVGTHTGPFQTPMGTIPPTGRGVRVPFCDVITMRDGKIAMMRTYFDSATFARQLGG